MNKGIIFFLGLFFGLMLCASIYYIDKKILKPIPAPDEEIVSEIRVDTVYIEVAELPKKPTAEPKPELPVMAEKVSEEQTEEEVSIFDSEFSFEESEEPEDVFIDQLLQSKIVKAVLHPLEKKEGKQTEGFFHIFELQQWSAPIKNKITYNRYQTLVKVKGLDLKNANVVFWNENFYLEVNKRYYPIPVTDSFEKLSPVTIP